MYDNRYVRNGTTVTEEEHQLLMTKRVLVAGCGGLGGYIIEMLARIGIGHLTVVDPDVFDETNLNRQLLCEEMLLGSFKSAAAAERVECINSEVDVIPVYERITDDNSLTLLGGHSLVIDALDNIGGRFSLQSACETLGIPLIHGAISGWFGQVGVILPGDRLFDRLYPEREKTLIDSSMGNPSFSPAVIAGLQVAEALKILIGKGEPIRNKILFIDMLSSLSELIEM